VCGGSIIGGGLDRHGTLEHEELNVFMSKYGVTACMAATSQCQRGNEQLIV
jgi:hypothetical protein